MYIFKNQQKVCEVGGVKFGGQPGEYPTVCCNSIFQKGDKVFAEKRKAGFDEKRAENILKNQDKLSAETGIPGMAGYCGTKFAVKGISHSLFKEVRKFGIKVTCIYPGSVRTNFFDTIPSVELNDGMMRAEDIAATILQCLDTHPNYHVVDVEVRPLNPRS